VDAAVVVVCVVCCVCCVLAVVELSCSQTGTKEGGGSRGRRGRRCLKGGFWVLVGRTHVRGRPKISGPRTKNAMGVKANRRTTRKGVEEEEGKEKEKTEDAGERLRCSVVSVGGVVLVEGLRFGC